MCPFGLSDCCVKPRRLRGLHTTTRELQTCTFDSPDASNTERKRRKKIVAGGGKKKREILGPPPFGAPPFGAPPFGAPPLRGPTLRCRKVLSLRFAGKAAHECPPMSCCGTFGSFPSTQLRPTTVGSGGRKVVFVRRCQLALDVTVVSTLHGDGTHRRKADVEDGVALKEVAKPDLAIRIWTYLAKPNFGQYHIWPFYFLEEVVGCSSPKGWGAQTWKKCGPRRVRAPKGGGPKFRAFFSLPPEISFYLLSLGGLLVEFWWCLKRRGAQMCTFGVLAGVSHHSREPKRAHLRVSVFTKTTKIQREDQPEREERMKIVAGEGNKRAKFWAVRRRVVRRRGVQRKVGRTYKTQHTQQTIQKTKKKTIQKIQTIDSMHLKP